MNAIRSMGLALLLAACGGRALPDVPGSGNTPGGSTRDPSAYDVTRALREDPPLPGAPASGWDGLAEAPPVDPHAHHRHGREPADPHAHHRHGGEAAPEGSAPVAPAPSGTGGGSHAH